MSGHNQDLSALARNLQEFRKIRFETKAKIASVYFDGEEIYKVPYKIPLGKIKGLELSFKGRGMTESVKFYDAHRQIVFADEFDRRND